MTYTETHALILNHNKHKQEQISKSFGNSYNTFTYIIILVTNLCFFRYLVYGTELILIKNLYLLRSYTDDILILIPISRRTHTYACIRRILIQVSQISRRSSQNLYLYKGTLRYNKAYTHTTEFTLVRRYPYVLQRYDGTYTGMAELILIWKYS